MLRTQSHLISWYVLIRLDTSWYVLIRLDTSWRLDVLTSWYCTEVCREGPKAAVPRPESLRDGQIKLQLHLWRNGPSAKFWCSESDYAGSHQIGQFQSLRYFFQHVPVRPLPLQNQIGPIGHDDFMPQLLNCPVPSNMHFRFKCIQSRQERSLYIHGTDLWNPLLCKSCIRVAQYSTVHYRCGYKSTQ